jgi:hypothetical protein
LDETEEPVNWEDRIFLSRDDSIIVEQQNKIESNRTIISELDEEIRRIKCEIKQFKQEIKIIKSKKKTKELEDKVQYYNYKQNTIENKYEIFDNIIKHLKNANIAFNVPETMRVQETSQIILLMSLGMIVDSLTIDIPKLISDKSKLGKIWTDKVKVSSKMEAYVTGESFTVSSITPIQQLIFEKEITCWEWIVTAQQPGVRVLYLTLNAMIDYEGEITTQTIQTYRKKIYVYVLKREAIMAWINRNISWLAGGLFSIFTLFLGFYLAIIKKRIEDKHENIRKRK